MQAGRDRRFRARPADPAIQEEGALARTVKFATVPGQGRFEPDGPMAEPAVLQKAKTGETGEKWPKFCPILSFF